MCALWAKGPVLKAVLPLGLSGRFSAAKSRDVNNSSTEGWLFVLRWGLLAGKLVQATLKRAGAQQEKCLSQGLSSWQINNSLAIFFFPDVLSTRKIFAVEGVQGR